MRGALVLLALLLVALPDARAQAAGSAQVEVNGVDVRSAALTRDALGVDASKEATLHVVLTAPPDAAWDVRAVRVSLVVASWGSALSRDLDVDQTVAPGGTLSLNRTVDLSALRPVGAGVYRAEVLVLATDGATLNSQSFYVRIAGNPFLTVAAAVATALSAASGYGLWRLLRDLRELNEARKRHGREREEKRRAAAKVGEVLGAGFDLTAGLEGVVGVVEGADPEAQRLAKRAPVAWTLTGLGVGGVAASWGQALGLLPFDAAGLAIAVAAGGALFLMLALLALGLAKRLGRRRPLAP